MKPSTIFQLLLFSLFLILGGCTNEPSASSTSPEEEPQPEAFALDGNPLFPPDEPETVTLRKDSLLAIARAQYEADSNNLENVIWLGRRTAYLNHFRKAIDIYSRGLAKFPESPELYRHRGHRYITIREFDKAIADFEKAAELVKDRPLEIEPDGLPNRLNIPLSNLAFNIYYHWALVHYLKGEFEKAAPLYETCMTYSVNPDLLCATTDWLYMTYRRLGQTEKAAKLLEAIQEDMDIIENQSYFNRLLMYKGLRQPADLLDLDNTAPEAQLDIVTQGYGVGNWYKYNDQEEKAAEIFRKVLATGYWAAFGYIAAEAEIF